VKFPMWCRESIRMPSVSRGYPAARSGGLSLGNQGAGPNSASLSTWSGRNAAKPPARGSARGPADETYPLTNNPTIWPMVAGTVEIWATKPSVVTIRSISAKSVMGDE
jgi:hypothetical protein